MLLSFVEIGPPVLEENNILCFFLTYVSVAAILVM